MDASNQQRMPAIFLAHGSHHLARRSSLGSAVKPVGGGAAASQLHFDDLSALGAATGYSRATRTVPLVYDFYGFPQKYYEAAYVSPGAPDLAQRLRGILAPLGPVGEDSERGLDHGAYVPLAAMYPSADIPVLQMSIPTMDPASLVALGRALAPLREEDVLIVGSGFLTHNLRLFDLNEGARPETWASEFDHWAEGVLARRDVDALVNYRERAPGVRLALPTHEHFVPVLVAAGSSVDASEPVAFPITGFTYGSAAKRSVQFG